MFWILAPISVLGALGLIFAKKAVHAALGMALVMVNLGIFYIAQEADFLGIIQIFVYTGAVMMLFLFVLMLVGVDSVDSLVETLKGQKWAGALLILGLAALLFTAIGRAQFGPMKGLASVNESTGNVSGVADLIFGKYVWTFEITSALLITAAARRDGAGPPRADRQQAEPARLVRAAHPREPQRRRSAGSRCLRPQQRGRHPGPAPRRHAERAVRLAGAHRP